MGTLLAQTAQTTTVLVWVGVLIGVVLLGGAAAWAVRRALLAKEESQSAMGLLESMRAMRDEGRMSAEEYDAARRAIARKAADEDKRGVAASEASGATTPAPTARGTQAPRPRTGPPPGGQRGGSQGGTPGGAGGTGGGAGRRPGGGPNGPGGGGGPASRG